MLERFLLAVMTTFSLSLLVHGTPQATAPLPTTVDIKAQMPLWQLAEDPSSL
jgi:hypothetical protein